MLIRHLFFYSLLWLSNQLFAHHGNFTYDGSTVITIEGQVTDFNWTNPHGSVELITGPGREVEIEVDGPSLIRPMGTTPDSLQPGDAVIAYVSPSNRGRNDEFLGREIIKQDGTVVRVSVAFARRYENETPPVTDSILGTWVPDRSNLFTHVASSEAWALTTAGQASFDAYDVSESFAQAECRAATTPTLMMYPTANRLEDRGDHIEINADWMGAVRKIYMDGRAHPELEEQFYQGHSIGRWEENTLVIDTANFYPNAIGNVFSIASGARKHVEERLSLDSGGSTLNYSFMLTDPDYLSEPVTATYQWHHRPEVSVSSEACDLESAGAFLEE